MVCKLALHSQKSNRMVITSRQKHQRAPLLLDLKLQSDPIEQVKSHEVLGVTIDQDLRWNIHITNTCKKLSTNLHLLSKLKPFVETEGRKMFFYGALSVENKLCVHCVVWCEWKSTKKLHSLHRRGAKLIINNPYFTTSEKLEAAGILPLQQQLDYNILMLMFKVLNELAPTYLHDFLRKAPERYGSQRFLLPTARIDMFKTSFGFVGPSLWNSLPSSVKFSKTVSSFKSSVKKHLNCCLQSDSSA